ncbi:hypothetical protein [Agarivorans aestuarii]|uniref:hypothetical protein n=1 Tax=Agarivorans aestuarii TaxID=1563703 RepID=UPI001C8179A9|nr:hypothetical protein [Agarivorans aestuarii]
MQSLQDIANKINSEAHNYKVGKLQDIRKNIQKLKRLPSKQLFDYRTVFEEWGWHYGGRKELQFNIGIEGTELRYGVAFSLECSQSLPDIDVLIPKISLFNEYMSEFGDHFSELRMWHFEGARSSDYMPSPIPQENVREGLFIFLGGKQDITKINYQLVLETLDRLLPLYLYTEKQPIAEAKFHEPTCFKFTSGCTAKLSSTSGTIVEKELNIRLRHNDLQLKLYEELSLEHGADNVGTEIKCISGSIDLVVKNESSFWFYEIKTASTARACIRQALGQILEYSYWPESERAEKMIIVGPNSATILERQYINTLRTEFGLPIEYLASSA